MTINTNYTNILIIIITHNTKEFVNRLMDSVKVVSDIYKGETDLIIVNSSTEPLEINDDWAKEIYVPEIPKPYKKSNIGAKQSKFDWLLYLDDDCIVVERKVNESIIIDRSHKIYAKEYILIMLQK